MRELTTGFERGTGATTAAVHGWTNISGTLTANSTLKNLDSSGAGGSHSAAPSAGTGRTSTPQFMTGSHREGFFRAYFFSNASGADWAIELVTGGTQQCSVFMDATDQLLRIKRGDYFSGTVLATAVDTVSAAAWHRIEVHYFIDDSAGFVHVYVDDDGSYTTPIVSITGADTKASASDNTIDRAYVIMTIPGLNLVAVDDVAVNSITMAFDGASGTAPSAGDTITGGTSGSTAVVSQVLGTTAGYLVLHSVSGAFTDNETITSGGWSASVNAPNASFVDGLTPNSAHCGPGFVVYLAPNGNGTTSGLTGTDGNSTDNYLLVDDDPVNATTEGVVATASAYDTYALPNLPASATLVNAVEVHAYGFKDGTTINDIDGAIRVGGTDYFTDVLLEGNLSSSADHYAMPFIVNPVDGANFDVADVNAAEAGVRMRP